MAMPKSTPRRPGKPGQNRDSRDGVFGHPEGQVGPLPRVGLYARVSTPHQHTIRMQLRQLREFLERRRWQEVLVVEEVVSGSRRRPERDRLLDAARRREIDIIEPFSDDASTRLAQSLEQNARQGVRGTALVRLAADTLHRWRVERPADSTLRRVIGSVSRTAEESAWVEIHDRVPPSLRDAMDKLLEVPAGAQRLPIPPLSEQASIVSFLSHASKKMDSSISRVGSQIALVREYRTRLIADVVIGKLDVREAAAQLPDEGEDSQSAPSPDKMAPRHTDVEAATWSR